MNKIQEVIFYLCNLIIQDRIFSRLFHSVSVIFAWALMEGTIDGSISDKIFQENIYTGKNTIEQAEPAKSLPLQKNGTFQMKIVAWNDGSSTPTRRDRNELAQNLGGTQVPQELSDYLIFIKQKIEANRYYPPVEQSAGHTAFITVKLTLDAQGNILRQTLMNPSTHPNLNRAALESIQRAEPFPSFPTSLRKKQKTLTVEFGLDYCLFEC